ncbi:hypothetical protein CR983_01665 [Candidatus Saccharibacteria bacterium]|nr:MAG: hypothetical protein CR983_01665 [Candidatus Saccharibacteria bacterium]
MSSDRESWQQPSTSSNDEYHAPVEEPAPDEAQAAPDQAESDEQSEPLEGTDEVVSWEAAEYIHREKGPLWYVGLGAATLLIILLAVFVIHSWSFAVLVPVMAAALVIYARRTPTVHHYTLSRKGLHVDDHLHLFDEFREFGLVHGDDEHMVALIPRKRLQLSVMVYFPEEVGEAIVDMLAARLPMKEVHLDPIDRLLRALHI